MILNLDWLKNNCEMIHYFGLGFIQLKINKSTRLHFYTSDLPPIVPEEDVHNHRYDFKSKILHGSFKQEIFEVISGDTHIRGQESCQPGIKTASIPESCGLKLACICNFTKGSEYFISHSTFHRVSANDCITLLERSDYKKELADVITPIGIKSICPFSKKVEENKLWEIIEYMLSCVS